MKKIICLLSILFVSFMLCDSCSAQIFWRKDVFISYDNLGTDAALKQFLKARKMNQLEILSHLVDQAEIEYRKCTSLDDLYTVKENIDIIKMYMARADQDFISITKRLKTLERNVIGTINDTLGASNGIQTIQQLKRYDGWGQELD